jgi:hypothetical protein
MKLSAPSPSPDSPPHPPIYNRFHDTTTVLILSAGLHFAVLQITINPLCPFSSGYARSVRVEIPQIIEKMIVKFTFEQTLLCFCTRNILGGAVCGRLMTLKCGKKVNPKCDPYFPTLTCWAPICDACGEDKCIGHELGFEDDGGNSEFSDISDNI